MSHKGCALVLQTIFLIVFLLAYNVDGAEVVIKNSSDCDRSFELTELSEMMINFFNDVRANCSLTINGSEGIDKHTRKCIEPEELNYGGCTVQVDVHNFIYLENSGDKKYSCLEEVDEVCTHADNQRIMFLRLRNTSHGDINIRLKVYLSKSEYRKAVDPVSWMIIICAGAGGLFVVCLIVVFVYRVVRERSRLERENSQPQFDPYSKVQYQPATQQIAGYQPTATEYNTT